MTKKTGAKKPAKKKVPLKPKPRTKKKTPAKKKPPVKKKQKAKKKAPAQKKPKAKKKTAKKAESLFLEIPFVKMKVVYPGIITGATLAKGFVETFDLWFKKPKGKGKILTWFSSNKKLPYHPRLTLDLLYYYLSSYLLLLINHTEKEGKSVETLKTFLNPQVMNPHLLYAAKWFVVAKQLQVKKKNDDHDDDDYREGGNDY